MKRRTFCLQSLLAAGLPAVGHAATATVNTKHLDDAMVQLLRRYGIPGGALGIVRAGKVVYTRGVGWADVPSRVAVQPDTLFRIASVSKPFTAATVLRLVEQGKLKLDDHPFSMLGLTPFFGQPDSRVGDITVRHLLQHTGGWDKTDGDPMFQSRQICALTGAAGPADVTSTIRYVLGLGLDFAPGSRYAYSNFGYTVLGALIEKVTGKPYAGVVEKEVLRPAGIKRMSIGQTLARLPDESCYYDDRQPGQSAFASKPGLVPWPYGVFSLETNVANGGWIASVEDLLKFAISLDEVSSRPLLEPATMQAMVAPPSHLNGAKPESYYGLGWQVRPQGQGGYPNLWHVGSIPGTLSLLMRLGDGFDWAVVFNKRPSDWESATLDIQRTIHKAAQKVGW